MHEVTDLVDDEQLLFALLTRDLDPSVGIAAELDVDSIDELPLVTFAVTGGDQGANGPGLWSCSLVLNVFGDGAATWETCKTLYRTVHNWAEPGASVIPGLGYVHLVDDLSKFSRMAAVQMQGKNITQYVGTFELTIRN